MCTTHQKQRSNYQKSYTQSCTQKIVYNFCLFFPLISELYKVIHIYSQWFFLLCTIPTYIIQKVIHIVSKIVDNYLTLYGAPIFKICVVENYVWSLVENSTKLWITPKSPNLLKIFFPVTHNYSQ